MECPKPSPAVHILLLFRLSALLNKAIIILFWWASILSAHEMTPAYPVLKPSYVSGVAKAEMSLFNYRSDIQYYQIDVFDADWNNVPFATPYRIMKVEYNQRNDFDVYIRNYNLKQAVYLCSTSKIKRTAGVKTMVSSRICSRLDGARP